MFWHAGKILFFGGALTFVLVFGVMYLHPAILFSITDHTDNDLGLIGCCAAMASIFVLAILGFILRMGWIHSA